MVRPGQPFLDWVYRADATTNELSLEELRRKPKVYLLPECENEEEARSIFATIRFSKRRCEPHAFILWRGPADV